jgi:hypothetical protein
MLDTGCSLPVKDSFFNGYNKGDSLEYPASRNQYPVSFGFLLKKANLKLVSFVSFLGM